MSSCTTPIKHADKKMHVAVFAFPFGSHALSLIDLVLKLARVAQETRFSFFNTEKSNNSIFLASRTNLPDNIKAYNVADGVPLNHVFSGHPIERVELFIKETPENFQTALDMAVAETGQKISCLLTDAFLSFAGLIAENLSVPWIPVWTPVPHSLSAHIYTDMIRQRYANSLIHDGSNSGRDGNDVELEDQTLEVPGLSQFHIADLPAEVLPRDAQETLFSCMLGQIRHMVPKVDTLVLTFYQELYSEPLLNDLKSKFSNLLNVGFISLSMPPPSLPPSTEDATGCLSWLDSQKAKSVAFISFGTVVNIPHSEIEELAEALEVRRIPFLWSLRDNMRGCLPNGFLDRTITHGKVVPWAPQIQVLGHSSIGVFMTHCGANSVYESIANGVPMICRPFFADHKLIARLIADDWRVGVRIDGGVFTKTGVAKSLDLILEREQGRTIRSRVLALKELVLKASAPGGRARQDFKILVEKITSV
ncbi:kaempferol 3-O-beta-D-galactosyltransferase-like [Populus nigra]|uniref:kaempferol 3-O-beta-D-galactosyltransferase-like n=1 Tax=Populus nigra TaxID=3691 RepID=UPI002B271C15|nr:kaempferol 3-O-beta-D-galactosyltransferase-like [Populus nigra]